jgi:DNA modification methylase
MNSLKIVSSIERWPIDRLIPYARNARQHSEKQVAQLAQSIRDNGFVCPVLVDKHGSVIGGHGRILAAQQVGLTELPVIVLDHLTETQAQALRLTDNRIAENASWNEEILQVELAALLAEQVDLTTLGFAELELKRILADLDNQAKPIDEDAAPEPPADPISRIGDLWNLGTEGEHRLLCGDSTLPQTLVQVLEGRPADLIYADLPYNVDYSGSPLATGADALPPILNDNLGDEFGAFLSRSCVSMLAVAGGAMYLSMGSSELHTLYKAFTDAGGHWSTYVIWSKDAFTLGRSDFQRAFEPILYGWKEGAPHYFCGERNLSDVWHIDKPRVNDWHPVMKPVALIEKAILCSSQKADLVLDPFAGSSTTLIACSKTGRRARLVELDRKYVDAAILRWRDFCGGQAVLASTGQSFEEVGLERRPG